MPAQHGGAAFYLRQYFMCLARHPTGPGEAGMALFLWLRLQLSLIRAEENAVRVFHSQDLLWLGPSSTGGPVPPASGFLLWHGHKHSPTAAGCLVPRSSCAWRVCSLGCFEKL